MKHIFLAYMFIYDLTCFSVQDMERKLCSQIFPLLFS